MRAGPNSEFAGRDEKSGLAETFSVYSIEHTICTNGIVPHESVHIVRLYFYNATL